MRMNNNAEEKRKETHQNRIDAIRTWLREDGAKETGGADSRTIFKAVNEEEAERLGLELIEEVKKKEADIDKINNLIRNGADTGLKDAAGWTALMWASGGGHKDALEALISGGVDVNLEDANGWTALMWASMCGRKAAVEVLVHVGADVKLRDKLGMTARDHTSNKDIKQLLAGAAQKSQNQSIV